jgi:hypothetical protein
MTAWRQTAGTHACDEIAHDWIGLSQVTTCRRMSAIRPSLVDLQQCHAPVSDSWFDPGIEWSSMSDVQRVRMM